MQSLLFLYSGSVNYKKSAEFSSTTFINSSPMCSRSELSLGYHGTTLTSSENLTLSNLDCKSLNASYTFLFSLFPSKVHINMTFQLFPFLFRSLGSMKVKFILWDLKTSRTLLKLPTQSFVMMNNSSTLSFSKCFLKTYCWLILICCLFWNLTALLRRL